jgi:menaquinol-cytochrome c reductase iron-sulfur subunit
MTCKSFSKRGGDVPSSEEARDVSPSDPPAIERRSFMRIVSGFGATVIAALIGIPVLGAFISPALQSKKAKDWIKVADDTATLDIGVPIRIDFVESQDDAWIESRALMSVWLYTEDGDTFKAYNGHCTHLGCGFVLAPDKKTFACPCHRGQFDVKTGAVLAGPPPRPLDELEVQVRDASVYVRYRDFRLGVAERVEA